ncbi:MAG: hypothetical protein JXA21_11260 [Anaerolineae bacterium]|nr:hypothetical protein [Anaerolineae bacterium]
MSRDKLAVDRHPVEQLLDIEQQAIKDFTHKEPDIWRILATTSTSAHALLAVAADLPHLTKTESLRVFLWQGALRYQFLSLKFIITHELDAAYTLLRNATELSRDIICIADNDQRIKSWFESKTSKKRDKLFVFDKSDPVQEFVFKIYKVASDWGTHGHFSGLFYGQVIGRVGPDNGLALVQVSEDGIRDALLCWLAGFSPIQTLCCRQFIKMHPIEFEESWGLFSEYSNLIGDMLKDIAHKK